jgi:hypothetical protein
MHLSRGWRCSVCSWWPLPTYCGRICAWAESTWPTVGRVDRRGQWKRGVCDARVPCQSIRSIMKSVFRWFRWICFTYESLRCLDIQIWRFLCWQTSKQTNGRTEPIALPLAHARGVIIEIILACTPLAYIFSAIVWPRLLYALASACECVVCIFFWLGLTLCQTKRKGGWTW